MCLGRSLECVISLRQEVEVDPLCTLFHLIRGASDRGGHFALFIDDISVLLNVGLSVQEVDNFISYCQQYIAQNQVFESMHCTS